MVTCSHHLVLAWTAADFYLVGEVSHLCLPDSGVPFDRTLPQSLSCAEIRYAHRGGGKV